MNEESSFNVTKTFESKQKKERSNIDYFAAHPQFWKNLPEELTKKGEILSLIHDGKAVKLKIPGYLSFYIKAIDVDGTRNGAHVLCWVFAKNRQQENIAGAYLINPEEVYEKWELELLRNSDRYRVRLFPVQFAQEDISTKKKQGFLHKEIKSLSFLDKEVF